jgi:6-phosphogluconolactonase (cycloisomerase 2 family)
MKKSCSFTLLVLCTFLILIFSGCASISSSGNPMAPAPGSPGGSPGGSGGGGGGSTPSNATQQVAVVNSFVPAVPAPEGSATLFSLDANSGALSKLTGFRISGFGGVTATPAGNLFVFKDFTQITSYAVQNGSTLTQLFTLKNSTALSGGGPVMHPSGQFFFLESQQGVTTFRLDPSGTITQLGTTAAPTFASMAAIHPSGRFLYLTDLTSGTNGQGQNEVFVYAIDPSTGSTSLAAGPINVGAAQTNIDLRLDASGKFMFIADRTQHAIYTYAVDQNTGQISLLSTADTGTNNPVRIAVTPNTTFLYMLPDSSFNSPAAPVLAYSISPAGTLTPVNGGAPLTVVPQTSFNAGVRNLAVDESGKFLYIVEMTQIAEFLINQSTGEITPTGAPVTVLTGEQDTGMGFLNFKK